MSEGTDFPKLVQLTLELAQARYGTFIRDPGRKEQIRFAV
jgi:hypothetical protein